MWPAPELRRSNEGKAVLCERRVIRLDTDCAVMLISFYTKIIIKVSGGQWLTEEVEAA
jgi:hypothetical protein